MAAVMLRRSDWTRSRRLLPLGAGHPVRAFAHCQPCGPYMAPLHGTVRAFPQFRDHQWWYGPCANGPERADRLPRFEPSAGPVEQGNSPLPSQRSPVDAGAW